MKYWDLKNNVATLKRQVVNNNHKLITFSFKNLGITGIRFLISTDNLLNAEEKKELLFEI